MPFARIQALSPVSYFFPLFFFLLLQKNGTMFPFQLVQNNNAAPPRDAWA